MIGGGQRHHRTLLHYGYMYIGCRSPSTFLSSFLERRGDFIGLGRQMHANKVSGGKGGDTEGNASR